jgi:CRISPR-associated protein Csb2
MPSLTIAWNYLTGYAVATDPTARERAEWPPHPARVFMALAAAWFETEPPGPDSEGRDDWTAEGEALRWLETLGDPEMDLPEVESQFERSNVTFYVPINDRAGPASAALQSCPAISRSKQPRTFPRVWVGTRPCFLHWPNAEGAAAHSTALDRLCRKVTRIGHSSSLVSMRLALQEPRSEDGVQLVADDVLAERQARSVSTGMLDMLEERYGEPARQQYAALSRELEMIKVRRKAVTGKGAKEQKAAIDEQIQKLESELSSSFPRPPVRPVIGLWTGYRVKSGAGLTEASVGLFDQDILILTHVGGPTLPVVSTLAVTGALRSTIMSEIADPVPDWVSGHGTNGEPLRDGNGHLALVPLPYVGHEHADGHLLGVALVFPRSISRAERGRVLGRLLVDESGVSKPLHLRLGRLGVWEVRKRDWQEQRSTLQPSQWTAAEAGEQNRGGATIFASVTPVVLDRFPKAERLDTAGRQAWEDEVRQIVLNSCARVALPEPALVDIDTTSWHQACPRAIGKRRPLRGHPGSENALDAALGDGFPLYPAKGTNAPRPQVHVWLQFPRPVIGPVILGAGRYQGYGLCKPLGRKRS